MLTPHMGRFIFLSFIVFAQGKNNYLGIRVRLFLEKEGKLSAITLLLFTFQLSMAFVVYISVIDG